MNELVKLSARPRLREPFLLSAWPGVSNVAMIVAGYLLNKLEFKRLGEIEPTNFFDPIGVVVQDSVIEAPQFPRSEFFYWKNKNGINDIILFTGEAQPSAKGYELANCVLDVGERFQVKRVYTFAAALTKIHHTEPPSVWGVGTSQQVADNLKQYNLEHRGALQIAGLNGLLLGVAKERDIEGVCLLGEVPMYTTRIQNPMAALAILRVLAPMLGIELDLTELTQQAGEATEKIKEVAAEAMGEYIDYFTEPIWEQGAEEEGEDEEDEDGGDEEWN